MTPSQLRPVSAAVSEAQELFRAWANSGSNGAPSAAHLIDLGSTLLDEQQFGYARRVLEHVVTDDPAESRVRAQKQALATYKDSELRTATALEHALTCLGDLAKCRD